MPAGAVRRNDVPVATRPDLEAESYHPGRGLRSLPGARGCRPR